MEKKVELEFLTAIPTMAETLKLETVEEKTLQQGHSNHEHLAFLCMFFMTKEQRLLLSCIVVYVSHFVSVKTLNTLVKRISPHSLVTKNVECSLFENRHCKENKIAT